MKNFICLNYWAVSLALGLSPMEIYSFLFCRIVLHGSHPVYTCRISIFALLMGFHRIENEEPSERWTKKMFLLSLLNAMCLNFFHKYLLLTIFKRAHAVTDFRRQLKLSSIQTNQEITNWSDILHGHVQKIALTNCVRYLIQKEARVGKKNNNFVIYVFIKEINMCCYAKGETIICPTSPVLDEHKQRNQHKVSFSSKWI